MKQQSPRAQAIRAARKPKPVCPKHQAQYSRSVLFFRCGCPVKEAV